MRSGADCLKNDQIGSYLAFPSFNNTFGNQVTDGTPSITAPWQAAGKFHFPTFYAIPNYSRQLPMALI